MEDDRKNTPNSGDTTPEPTSSSSSDFEFGSLSPSSPSHSDNSPADHLFLNGRLLPHTFPTTRSPSLNTYRSNSTSSRSSDSSTPRTSTTCKVFKITSSNMTSDKEKTNLTCFGPRSKKVMDLRPERPTTCSNKDYDYNHHKPCIGKKVNTTRKSKNITYLPTQCKSKKATEIVTAQLYGVSSQQWQHITPVFKRQVSVKVTTKKTARRRKKKTVERSSRGSKVMKWWKRVLKAVVIACRECHAMEPQRLVNHEA